MSRIRVAVIGAGVIGLSTAVRAIEIVPGLDITIVSEEFSPNTTGDGSAGYICPYLLGVGLPLETLKRWFQNSWEFFLEICHSPDGGKSGVGLIPAYYFYNSPEELQESVKILPGYRQLTERELEMCPVKHRFGVTVSSLFVECLRFLPYLMDRFKRHGGNVIKRRINCLSELTEEFDVIINCAGLGAAHIVPDPSVIPIRGQVIRVKAPWVKSIMVSGEHHIIPNTDSVLLGGTHQEGDWNTRVNAEDSRNIWRGCCRLVPSLEKAEILNEWVGLRPYRKCPRLDRETMFNSQGQKVEVIHNYGHGGSGVTLSWGCAVDAVNLLRDAIGRSQSKL